MKPMAIKNAPHWLNHSHVITKGRMTAGDVSAIANAMITVEIVDSSPVVITKAGNQNLLKVQRMVTQGTVAVMIDEGETYEVKLPQEAEDLLPDDLLYICNQIDAKSRPLNAEEQKRFLSGANGRSETNLNQENLSPMSL